MTEFYDFASLKRPSFGENGYLLQLAEYERLVGTARDHLKESMTQNETHRSDRR
jgi:hypothetical protein